MTAGDTLIQLHDLDLLLSEAGDRAVLGRYRRVGLTLGEPAELAASRARLLEQLDPRWRHHYERALGRYGTGIAGVRGRVCQGCFMGVPRSATPGEELLMLCESCGRVLLWEPRVTA